MPIDIGGTFTVSGFSGTQALNIAGGANTNILVDTTGRVTNPNQIGFIAGYTGTDPGWISMAVNAWMVDTYFNTVAYNKGGGFNTANSRFTAPISGIYLSHFSDYMVKASPAVQGNIWYFAHAVNGSPINNAKPKGHFQPQGYAADAEVEDLLYLNAGDYLEMQCQGNNTNCQFYPFHAVWDCFLVG